MESAAALPTTLLGRFVFIEVHACVVGALSFLLRSNVSQRGSCVFVIKITKITRNGRQRRGHCCKVMSKLTNKGPAELRPPNMKPGYALPMIDSTSSPSCTKPFLAEVFSVSDSVFLDSFL